MSGAATTIGELEVLRVTAPSLALAHGELGARLAGPIRSVCQKRWAALSESELAEQLATLRACRAHLTSRTQALAGSPLGTALAQYLACLAAWAEGAALAQVAHALSASSPLDALDVALWLQDDNTGCQTGALRAHGGSILLFHTEEDTIGYFDRPRLLVMRVGEEERASFLYPYLLPGPAFGWQPTRLVAYDTLSVRRTTTGGTLTSTLSWLLWAERELLPEATARALTPFLDGGAFTVITRAASAVHALTLEVGGHTVCTTRLGSNEGCRHIQLNATSSGATELRALELLSADERAPYEERFARAERLLGCAPPSLATLLSTLASREGGSWAFANDDVVAHLVAQVSSTGMTLWVGAGPAGAPGSAPTRFSCP